MTRSFEERDSMLSVFPNRTLHLIVEQTGTRSTERTAISEILWKTLFARPQFPEFGQN